MLTNRTAITTDYHDGESIDVDGVGGLLTMVSPLSSPADRDLAPREGHPSAAEITYAAAENRDLRAEVVRLRTERDRLAETQRRIMDVLGAQNPDRLVHDLRNVLNERALYKALAEPQM